MDPIQIVEVDALECWFKPVSWEFAQVRREAIAAHWETLSAANPSLFNGQILLLHGFEIENRVFRGRYHRADYASFLAWRDFGHPGTPRWNGFGMAALRSADGAFILGEMAAHTANPGAVYFAAGTPDDLDIVGDRVDIAGSILRELAEETGVEAHARDVEKRWTIVMAGPRVAILQRVNSPLAAGDLKRRIEAFLASEEKPELSRIHVIGRRSDMQGLKMPDFQQAYLHHVLA